MAGMPIAAHAKPKIPVWCTSKSRTEAERCVKICGVGFWWVHRHFICLSRHAHPQRGCGTAYLPGGSASPPNNAPVAQKETVMKASTQQRATVVGVFYDRAEADRAIA